MENKQTKISCLKVIFLIGSFLVFVFIFVLNVFFAKECQIENKIISYGLPFLLQGTIFYFIIVFIETIINENNKTQWVKAIAINLLLTSSTTMFILNYEYLKDTVFQIVSLVSLFLILLYIKHKIVIKKESNLSPFKAINYFMVVLWSALMFFLKKCGNDTIESLVTFYCLLPLLMIQGFYELLENKKYRQLN